MEYTPWVTVYRVRLADGACRSARELLAIRAEAIDGVRAATVTPENELIVLAQEGAQLFENLVEAMVRVGLDPVSASVATLECRVEPVGLSLETALAVGLVQRPKEPVRAMPVQRAHVHVNGGYDPDTIILSAQVPSEISFSEGHECLARVVFDSLGIEADLENGGALVSLPPLEAGRYEFRCGRNVVHGALIAE
jgi:hypothetical protein